MMTATAMVAACCLWVLWEYASRGDQLSALLLGGWAMVITGGIWVAVAVAGMNAYGAWRLSVVAPLLFVLSVTLLYTGAPQRVGWLLSRPALDRAAATCTEVNGTQRVGLYRIDHVRATDRGCTFSLAESGFGIDGFAYIPSGAPEPLPPNASAGDRYRHVDGPWYSYASFLDSAA